MSGKQIGTVKDFVIVSPSDATQPAADDQTPSAAASPAAANENSPNEGADASQAVRSLPSWLVAEAAKAIEMHAQAKGCPEDGFFVGWWGSFLEHRTSGRIHYACYTEQFYALVKEK